MKSVVEMTNGLTAANRFKEQINNLMLDVFGFSFDRFHAQNVWNDEYESYSIMEHGRMLANASVYKMQLLVDDKPMECLQIGAVATREELRGQGLGRAIQEEIERRYPGHPAFLYANDRVLDFYKKFGYRPAVEYQPYVKRRLHERPDLPRLEIIEPAMDNYLRRRSKYSKRLDCLNSYAVNWFHMLYGQGENAYEIPDLDVMVVMEREERTLTLYDVVSDHHVDFEELLRFLPGAGVDTIAFGFTPDWLGAEYDTRCFYEEDSTLMIKNCSESQLNCFLPRLTRT